MSRCATVLRVMSGAGLCAGVRRGGPDAHEAALVAQMRAKGGGWYRIAQAIGRSEPDTRAWHDPDYEPTWRPREGLAMKRARPPLPVLVEPGEDGMGEDGPRENPRTVAARTRCSPMEAKAVLALADGPLSALQVGEVIGRPRDQTSNVLAKLVGKGMVRHRRITVKGRVYLYSLTEFGREVLGRAQLEGFDHG